MAYICDSNSLSILMLSVGNAVLQDLGKVRDISQQMGQRDEPL